MLVLAVNPPLVPDQQPAARPACYICVRAWQCRQQHPQCPLCLYSLKKPLEIKKIFCSIIDSRHLVKKAPRLVAARLPSLPAGDLFRPATRLLPLSYHPAISGLRASRSLHPLPPASPPLPALVFGPFLSFLCMHFAFCVIFCLPHRPIVFSSFACMSLFLIFHLVGNRHATPSSWMTFF